MYLMLSETCRFSYRNMSVVKVNCFFECLIVKLTIWTTVFVVLFLCGYEYFHLVTSKIKKMHSTYKSLNFALQKINKVVTRRGQWIWLFILMPVAFIPLTRLSCHRGLRIEGSIDLSPSLRQPKVFDRKWSGFIRSRPRRGIHSWISPMTGDRWQPLPYFLSAQVMPQQTQSKSMSTARRKRLPGAFPVVDGALHPIQNHVFELNLKNSLICQER